ncbi:339_t:CDS:1, partial [Funneliformis mosseae]
IAKAFKEAVANAEAVLEGQANAETNERAMVEVKKKRSIIGEHYYEEFSTEF